MRVAITQSNYIPWKGYFDLINAVDALVLYDDVQYTRRDWRNRNRIKSAHGPLWLTVPVKVKGRYDQTIAETEIADPAWGAQHWQTITHAYARAPYFKAYRAMLEPYFLGPSPLLLSKLNQQLIIAVCEILGIKTRISQSREYTLISGKNERLIGICRQLGATTYLSGPAAKTYIDERLFAEAGISVEWMEYSGYPEYEQLYPPFEHAVSVLDLLFMAGQDAPTYMKSFQPVPVHGRQP